MTLLNTGRLFNTLLEAHAGDPKNVANELDPFVMERLPFYVFRSVAARDRNHPELWGVSLTIYLYADPAEGWARANALDDAIASWCDASGRGIVPGVGAVETMDSETTALGPVSLATESSLTNKSVIQFIGSWTLTVRGPQ